MSSQAQYINASCPQVVEDGSQSTQSINPTRDPVMLEWFNKTMIMRSEAASLFPILLEQSMNWANQPASDHKEGKDKFYALTKLIDTVGMPAPATNFSHIKSETEVKHKREEVKPAVIISRAEALDFARLAIENDKEEREFKEEQKKKLEVLDGDK